MAVFAEFEHDMIREYTMDGLVSDRPQGGTGGRLTVMDDDTLVAVRAARANNESLRLDRQSTGSLPCIYLQPLAHQQHLIHAARTDSLAPTTVPIPIRPH